MKKQIILGSFLALAGITSAQNLFPSSGNTGIGILSPVNALDIRTGIANDGISITQTLTQAAALHLTNNAGGKHWALFSTGSGNGQGNGNFSIYEYAAGIDRLFINGTSGNVGISTNAPTNKLEILTSIPSDGLKITQNTLGAAAIHLKNTTSGGQYWSMFSLGNGNGSWGPGNFAISTSTNSGSSYNNLFLIDKTTGQVEVTTLGSNTGVKVIQSGNTAATMRIGHTNTAEGNWALMAFGSGTGEGAGNFGIYNQNNLTTPVFIAGSSTNPSGVNPGNVGIGTNFPKAKLAINLSGDAIRITDATNTTVATFLVKSTGATAVGGDYIPAGYMFSVNGKIIAEELNVLIRSTWPDYVFKKDYKMMSLSNLESFINKYQHLPNVPSAEEVEKNGANLGEITKIQMEKIEELTLYIIELEKRLKALENK